MTKNSGFTVLRVTICCVIALALSAGVVSYGFSNQLLAHGPFPPPCDPASGSSSLLAHGPFPPPCDPASGSSSLMAHGPFPPPCDPASGSSSLLGIQS